MNPKFRELIYALLGLQVVSSLLALSNGEFLFKSGSAGIGALILLLFSSKKRFGTPDLWMLIGAFVFSIVGDFFLSTRDGDTMRFVYGIFFFLLAHIGYLNYSLYQGKIHWGVTALFCGGYLIFFFTSLYPAISDVVLLWAALAYLFVSCFSLGTAWGIRLSGWAKRWYVFGIVLILFSDTLIAIAEFMANDRWDFLVLPTYYLAHIVITWSIWQRFQSPGAVT
ncbi:lysoplasmalogenase [Robiginitalea aurantiaca]|uniref:Lysoplasmalogenase n=1 Tax=Robiginitalea aurantiaca TaxID=3056915 RepID=A0ABT7WHG1_9FLAO|nr:lysoplasmalogenase [Robiginitalea aurantiaca]MDM9632244.1 lysoplasmalogenase [Robiginitalea aurantiaca]